MTITLQDVSCLWGLPIHGDPVGGISDGDYGSLVEPLLGIPEHEAKKKRKIGTSAEMVSQYHMKLKVLRDHFRAPLPEYHTHEQLLRYTRAYILDLFGSVMFADSSGDCVPMMYLTYLTDLDSPRIYNWGSAVLVSLYRQLCCGCLIGTKGIAGPVVLLQQWSWTRLPVSRPLSRVRGWSPDWGGPDPLTRPAYGARWCCLHTYVDSDHGGTIGPDYVRGQLQSLKDHDIEWEPYLQLFRERKFCKQTMDDGDRWLYRGPLIHYWIIEYHYPNRVLRQFGLRQ